MQQTHPAFSAPARLAQWLLAGLVLGGCQSPAPVPSAESAAQGVSGTAAPAPAAAPIALPRSLAGHWEKDYRLSDDFSSRLALYVADIQRRYGRTSSRDDGIGPAVSNTAINGLARFTEELTRMPTLAIEQDAEAVSIEREQDFPLHCQHGPDLIDSGRNPFGADACGWNGQRLIFTMQLAGGLNITHQFSLSADGDMLDLTTTVASDTVAAPLTVRNLYRRYDPPADPYDCVLTLTRSRVCSQRGNNP